ncbi:MAG TPA: helix-turn-helix transcriptional regulator [Cytophagales bacterium]|nr:helix-turn-helix transcriptional regulator [Cytophagales bacterium]
MKVGTKIKRLRELKNLTPKVMASRLGMTNAGYSKIERDEVSLTLERLSQIAGILEVLPEEVLSFDERYVVSKTRHTRRNSKYGIPHEYILSEKVIRLYEEKICMLEDRIKFLEFKLKFLEEIKKD